MDVGRIVRGVITIPAKVRREAGLSDGTIVRFEAHRGHVIVRRVKIVPDDSGLSDTRDSDAEVAKAHTAVGPVG